MIWVAAAVVAVVLVIIAMRMMSGGDDASPSLQAKKDSPKEREERNNKAEAKERTPDEPEHVASKDDDQPSTEPEESKAKDEDASEEQDGGDPKQGGPTVPMSVPPPANDFDDDWDDVDITMVAELPEEIKALQRGYRSVDPKEAVAEVVKKPEEYDDAAEIEIVDEREVDELLVEELLNDDDTGPNALVFVAGTVRSDQGRRRPNNEDRPLAVPEHFVFGVADGMGGHAAGEVASGIAAKTIEQAFRENEIEGEPHNLWPRRGDELARTIEMANRAIYHAACEDDSLTGMGTTLTAVRFCPERQRAYIAHVGDSRCYRIRDGALLQLTKDHTLGAELGAKGKMATHLSRSVGIAETVEVDLMVDAPRVGDLYLICSDGLTKMVSEERMTEIAIESETIEDGVNQMIEEANEAGGKDNITIALVEIRDPKETGLV